MRYDRAEYRLRIVSTLDVLDPMTDEAMFPIRSAQLTAAGSIVVTKLDRAGNDEIGAAARVAKRFNPSATRIALVDRRARARAVFAPAQIKAPTAPSQFQAIAATNHSRLGVFLAEWPAAVPWADLSDWLEDLAGFCGDRLLRVKGLVSVVGVPQSVLIDGVGTTFAEPRRMRPDPSGRRGLVIIARDVDLAELTAFSAEYLAESGPP